MREARLGERAAESVFAVARVERLEIRVVAAHARECEVAESPGEKELCGGSADVVVGAKDEAIGRGAPQGIAVEHHGRDGRVEALAERADDIDAAGDDAVRVDG